MRETFLFTLILFCSSADLPAETSGSLTAEQIMQRVAANQDQAETLRRQYVYKQHIHVASRKTNGLLMQEETADYDVFPNAQGSSKKLVKLLGKYWSKGEYLTYSTEAPPDSDSIDGDLVSDLRDDLANERKSKDGLAANLFPLTSKEQRNYKFKLIGNDVLNGRSVYHISFWPRDKSDTVWKGEAFIDTEEFQPVSIFTKLSRKVPLVIRTALGTNLPDVGFSVTYQRQPDSIWFPSSFGTEFRLRALFFINRQIAVSLRNSDFEKTHVESIVHYDANHNNEIKPQ